MHIFSSKKRAVTILKDVSGYVKPSRMTLLLGPPGSGKTTLLLALAGKLDSALRVRILKQLTKKCVVFSNMNMCKTKVHHDKIRLLER